MKRQTILTAGILMLFLFLLPNSASAFKGWITEIHNNSDRIWIIKTTDANKGHRGEVKKGESWHKGKNVTKNYSNWKDGIYIIYPGDKLYVKSMGMPWYQGGGHYIRIWNTNIKGLAQPKDYKNIPKDSHSTRMWIQGKTKSDYLVVAVGDNPVKELKLGLKSGVGGSASWKLVINKDHSFHMDITDQHNLLGNVVEFSDEHWDDIAPIIIALIDVTK